MTISTIFILASSTYNNVLLDHLCVHLCVSYVFNQFIYFSFLH